MQLMKLYLYIYIDMNEDLYETYRNTVSLMHDHSIVTCYSPGRIVDGFEMRLYLCCGDNDEGRSLLMECGIE